MKFFIILASIFFGPYVVTADRMVRFVFNSGIVPTPTQTCTSSDNTKLDAIFNPVVRRNLRTTGNSTRGLWAPYCKDNCKGYATGTCRATNCYGYRRRELSDETSDRELQTTCTQQVDDINDALDSLVSSKQLSTGCISFIDAPKRLPSCYDDVIYGEIERVALWTITGDTTPPILTKKSIPFNGYTVCHNANINLEAIVNTCVDFVRFYMTGPNSFVREYTENDIPYSVFGDSSGQMHPKSLTTPGIYTLTITPDGFVSKQKIYKIKSVEC